MHGYGILLHIHRASDDLLRVEEGSLCPALHRIERSGWINSEWGASENDRRADCCLRLFMKLHHATRSFLAGVLVTMVILGVVATWMLARHALAVDPAKLLREQ
jgi:hypothetical protein